MGVESNFEYGSRQGFWRVLELFRKHNMVFTCYAIGKAIEENPTVVPAMEQIGCEIASHAYRWIDYNLYTKDPEAEKVHVRMVVSAIRKTRESGKPPVGWYTGRDTINTKRLVQEVFNEMNIPLLYNSDAYNDDLPYWIESPARKGGQDEGMLIVPYTGDNNDMRFDKSPGFTTPDQFFEYLKAAFDTLYQEGLGGSPKMMSIGLHGRLIGRPGRIAGLREFMEYIESKPAVWITTREEIARHWRSRFPYSPGS